MQYLYHLIVHWGSGGHNVNICIYKSTNCIMLTSGNNGRRKGHSHQTHLSVCWLVHNLSGTWILDIYTPQFLCLGHLLTSDSQCTGFQKFLKNHGENFHFIPYHLNIIVICLKLKAICSCYWLLQKFKVCKSSWSNALAEMQNYHCVQ